LTDKVAYALQTIDDALGVGRVGLAEAAG